MKRNPVKERLSGGRAVIGSEISRLRSPDVARIYAAAGFDFVFIDTEHSSFNLETVADMIQTARAWNIVPIVRVPQAEYPFVTRVLDQGAQGVIVPRVNTPEQVRQIVSWVRYPPNGIRGFACTTAQSDGANVLASEFVQHNDRETVLIIQIERLEAIANLDEMLSIEGVDVACLGIMDLTVDLGIPGETNNPETIACIDRLVEAADAHGVASGIISADQSLIRYWVDRGMRFISYATEEILLQKAANNAVQRLSELRNRQ